MKKGLIFAAALSAIALSGAGSASAAPALGQLGGLKAAGAPQLEQVYYRSNNNYRSNHRYHNRRWYKPRYHKQRHCFLRVGRRICVLR